jgi:POT family proton-dependent oligopeptide transporter
MTVLAPTRIGGLMMGVWFLATSVGNFIGGRVSGLYESFPLPSLFGSVAGFAIAAGLLLMILSPSMRRLMPGPKVPVPAAVP